MYHTRSFYIVMTHYYYYVSAGPVCDEMTKIYKVAVGTNKQSQRDFAFISAYALSHGHYFSIVSNESSEFISRLRRSLQQYNVQLDYLSCRDLCRLLRSALAPTLNQSHLLSAVRQTKILNGACRATSNLNRMASSSAKRSTSKTSANG